MSGGKVTHLLVADEMGSPGISHPFVSGGYVIPVAELQHLKNCWRVAKETLCGTANVELKWKHFFPPLNQSPLLQKYHSKPLYYAKAVLRDLFKSTSLLPLLYVYTGTPVYLDSSFGLATSRSNRPKLDREFLYISLISLFAVYLSRHSGTGEIWHDALGSPQEEERHQKVLRDSIDRAINSPHFSEGQRSSMKRIKEKMKFQQSDQSEAVQVADMICGPVYRAASRGSETDFLSLFANRYGIEAERNGVGIFRLD